MKKENGQRKNGRMARVAVLLCAVMLFPLAAVGCQSAEEMVKNRERAAEVGRLAEKYMQEKYNRGYKVRKCEAAPEEAYKGNFFISFNNGGHAYYDTEEDIFYDDLQAEVINESIMREIWIPMFENLGVPYENVNDWSQTFNMVYRYRRGGKDIKYSMYHEYFKTTIQFFCVHSKLSVTSDNLILVADRREACKTLYDKIRVDMDRYFKGQEKGELHIYAVTPALAGAPNFDPEAIDETTQDCLAHFYFKDTRYCAVPSFVKLTDGLYINLCGKEAQSFTRGNVSLVPVEDTEAVSKSMIENMDSKEIGLIDKYTGKKRDIDFEGAIYRLEISSGLNQKNWKDVTVAFMMKDSDEPIAEYAEMNEKEHSFFGYNMNGTEFNATCLCSPNSRSVMFTYAPGDEVYFWFGSQK